MKLKYETVQDTITHWSRMERWRDCLPEALSDTTHPERANRFIQEMYEDLADMFYEKSKNKKLDWTTAKNLARKQARSFPRIADLWRGFDAPETISESQPDMSGYYEGE